MGQTGCKTGCKPGSIQGTMRRPACKDAATLASNSAFSVSEVEALYELFTKLRSKTANIPDGVILKAEFQLALFKDKNKTSVFSDRVFDIFDTKKIGGIEFDSFVRNLSIFHPSASQDDKIAFAFRLYDPDNTGYIERKEVKMMLEALLASTNLNLTPQMIESILDKTFADAKPKSPNKIDKAEWKNMVLKQPSLINNMTLPYLKDLTTTFPGFIFSTEQPDP